MNCPFETTQSVDLNSNISVVEWLFVELHDIGNEAQPGINKMEIIWFKTEAHNIESKLKKCEG